MADSQSFDSIVEQYIQPLIATNVNSPEDGKSVGILVGIMFVGARNYYSFGSIGPSGVATEEVVSFIGSNTKVFTATLLGLADYQKTTIPITGYTTVASLLPSDTTIGTYLAIALPVLVGLTSADPIDGVLALAFALVYQQIENLTIEPKISADAVDMHPAVSFGS